MHKRHRSLWIVVADRSMLKIRGVPQLSSEDSCVIQRTRKRLRGYLRLYTVQDAELENSTWRQGDAVADPPADTGGAIDSSFGDTLPPQPATW